MSFLPKSGVINGRLISSCFLKIVEVFPAVHRIKSGILLNLSSESLTVHIRNSCFRFLLFWLYQVF